MTSLLWRAIGVVVFLTMRTVNLNAGESPVLWHEGEAYTEAPGNLEHTTDEKLPASGSRVLSGSVLATKGNRAGYDLQLPRDYANAKIVFRHARMEWPDRPTAEMICELNSGSQTITRNAVFDTTDGWGYERKEWGLLEVPLGQVKKGPARLNITSTSDLNDVVVDGFFIAPADFKITRDELKALSRVRITSSGYLGLDLTYSSIEQKTFPGCAVVGRGFAAHEEKVSVQLLDAKGQVAVALSIAIVPAFPVAGEGHISWRPHIPVCWRASPVFRAWAAGPTSII